MSKICVDASLVVKWLVEEEGCEEALTLLERWNKESVLFVAPSLLDYEIGTVLRQKVLRGFLRSQDIYPAIELYEQLGIQLFHITKLVFKSLAVAETLSQPSIYDVSYLLTAQQQQAELYTADKRFYNAAKPLFEQVKYYA